MYEELVKRLREPCQYENCVLCKEAADAIEELVATVGTAYNELANNEANKLRWIPVTERLPEKRKWVLCRCEANIIEVLRWENNEWYHDPMHVYYPSFVTHWMPLPAPDSPKEET